jgi:hypothetical protein
MKHITKTVDQIAELSAQIAELNDHKKALIESLKAEGEGRYCGTEHYLQVSVSERATLDMSAVRKKLSRQFIASHTRVTEVVTASLKGYNKDRRVA